MNEPTPSSPAPDRPASSPGETRLPPAAGPGQDGELDLGGLFAELMGAWPLILLITLGAVLCTGAYLFSATPRYQATALVQIDVKRQETPALQDLSSMFSDSSVADTEIQLLESRSLLEKVVENQDLLVVAAPVHFPVIGSGLSHRWERTHATLAPPFLGLGAYAWGGEKIHVDQFVVPERDEGRPFRLVAGKPGEFDLFDPGGALLLHGRVGALESGPTPARIEILVSALAGNPGTRFVVTRRNVADAVSDLRGRLSVSEQGKDTGIIALRLQGEDPARMKRVLDDLCEGYLRRNVEHRSAAAEQALQFFDAQLPALKHQLDGAELALRNHRSRTGVVDLKMETQALLDRSVDVERRLSELNLRRAELLQRFTPQHPELISLDSQIQEIERSKQELTRALKTLPDTELRSAQLMRDVRVATDMYVLLLNKAQELRVVKSGTMGSARIIDPAAADASAPLWPKRDLVLTGGLLSGLLLGLIAAGVRRSMARGVEHPDTLEQTFGLPVLATVPHTRSQRRAAAKRGKPGVVSVLAERRPKDAAVESLRSLRTVLQPSVANRPGANVVMVTGLRPGVGKSFVSTNLAALFGAGRQRVLFIDGDLRRGVVHQTFGTPQRPGLSEVASGLADIREAILPTALSNVFFLPTGELPPNPSEVLLGPHLAAALEWASQQFDVVLIDAPPALGVTDSALMGRHAGTTLLVVQWGLHSPREIALALGRLRDANVRVSGFVFNAVPRHSSAYGYGNYGAVPPR